MSSKKIKSDNLVYVVTGMLDEFSKDVMDAIEDALVETAEEAVKELKTTSPKGYRGRYRRGWRKRQEKINPLYSSWVIHNATDWRLTHLLEHGHVIKNKYGTFGRTTPQPHIGPAQERAGKRLVQLSEKKLKELT